RPVSWERALDAAKVIGRHKGHTAALVGGQATNEEAFLLQRLLREGMDSGDVDCRVGPPLPLELHQALAAPALAATVSDLEWARAVLVLDCEPVDEAPILELRLRKGHRRHRVALAIAGARPSALDADAALTLRYEPGGGPAFVAALRAALRGGPADGPLAELVALLRGREGEANAGEVVILWSERLARGPHGPGALADLHAVAGLLGLAETAGAGLLEVPSSPNGRGLREAGMLPGIGPGYAAARPGRDAAEIARATAAGEITALYLLGTDPLDSHPDHEGWERALEKASTIVAHAEFLTEGLREHATVVFPAQSYAEKEGTVVHPDGRLQRLRPGIANPGTVRPEWYVLADVADRVGHSLGILTGAAATAQLIDAVPFYHGLSLEEIGGRGVRWPERDSAARLPAATPTPGGGGAGAERPAPEGALRLGTYRPVWASAAVQASPALAFLHPLARVELSPADAAERGLEHGQQVQVRDLADETRALLAIVELRHAVPAGSAFLPEGIPGAPATRFTGADGAVFVQVEIPPEPEPELEGELDESGMPIVVGGEDFEPPEASPEPELP
ncbi:MAG TPA: molybdopterin-dependent oxidoreductase, partial [Solirubrobacteraceae bacterium]|nr:molybdopterin-dependent oxidoreductase [Solirubrobacteraceae bacterium]